MNTKLTVLSLIAIMFFAFTYEAKSEPNNRDVEKYIEKYYPVAIREMMRSKVPASIKLAQGILESGAGSSELASKSNNHFGIKCKNHWMGEKVYHDDDAPGECFRKYTSVEDSYSDHSIFLINGERYSSLFKMQVTDYIGWAKGLKSAGYATNPLYANKLIKLIEQYELYRYDQPEKFEIPVDKRGYKLDAQMQYRKNKKTEAGDHKNTELTVLERDMLGNRQVYRHNRCDYIFSQAGDTWDIIARATGLKYRNLIAYNNVTDLVADIPVGSYIYIGKKRKNTGLKNKDYVVSKKGETIYTISQKYALITEVLCETNSLMQDEVLPIGKQILLK